MIVETPSFLELDYTLVAKILESCELHVSSETEVYNAGDLWLAYNIEKRRKFAKNLLLKVRFSFFSAHTIRILLEESSTFSKDDECARILKEVLDFKTIYSLNKTNIKYPSRYCNQHKFNTLMCVGIDKDLSTTTRNEFLINASNLRSVDVLPPMKNKRYFPTAVCVKGDVYVFHQNSDSRLRMFGYLTVERYSPSTNTWNEVADMYDDIIKFCACAFMDKVFIIGGYIGNDEQYTETCLVFDTESYKWKKVASMNEARIKAACSVFEGRIVVAGGYNDDGDLNTVESYDVLPDKWSPMPNMTDTLYGHRLVAVKNKLFVIASYPGTCQVFDSSCRKFISLKSPEIKASQAVVIRSKIVVFEENKPAAICYDVDTNEWSEEPCEVTKNLSNFACVNVPWYEGNNPVVQKQKAKKPKCSTYKLFCKHLFNNTFVNFLGDCVDHFLLFMVLIFLVIRNCKKRH